MDQVGTERPWVRVDEATRIASVLASLPAGRGESLLVVGEAGAGKSLLLQDARCPDGTLRLTGQGVPAEQTLPYAGLHRVLHPVGDEIRALQDGDRGAALAEALRLRTDGHPDRTAVGLALLHLLHRLTATAPVAILVDDLQWFDDDSLQVLGFLIGRTAGVPVAIIGASRCDASALGLPDMAVAQLPGLDGRAAAELVAALCGAVPPRAVVNTLVAGVAGNLRALVELTGTLSPQQIAGVARLPDPLPPGPVTERIFGAPARQLPTATQQLLLLAAADPGLTATDLSRVAEAVGARLEDLADAEDAGLVTLDTSGVTFRHPLTRAAAYHCARPSLRRQAHDLLARVCPDRALRHREAAALAPDAGLAAELAEAAVRARTEHGLHAAAQRMLRAAELTPPGSERVQRLVLAARDTWHGGDPVLAGALLDAAATQAGDHTAGSDWAEVEILRAEIGLRRTHLIDVSESMLTVAGRLEPDHTALKARALVLAALAAWYAGDLRRLRKAAHHADALHGADVARLPAETRLALDYMSGNANAVGGHCGNALARMRRAVATAQSVDDPDSLVIAARSGIALNDEALVHAFVFRALHAARTTDARSTIPHAIEILALVECWTGRFLFTSPHLQEGIRLARETGQPNTESTLLAVHAMLAAIHGSAEDCQRYAREAITLARDNDGGSAIAFASWALGLLDLIYGRSEAAYRRLGELYVAGPGSGSPIIAMYATPYFVEAAVGVGATEEARRALAPYDEWARSLDRAGLRALAERCHALLADGPAKERHFRRSLDEHTRSSREFERGYTELLLARHLRRGRRRGDAREHLNSALETFERLNLHLWVKRVQVELRATGERRPANRAEPGPRPAATGLTTQQLQIVRHVAGGATNRETAEQLFISSRTVDYHLRNIYSRLGIRSRAELIRMFGEQALSLRNLPGRTGGPADSGRNTR